MTEQETAMVLATVAMLWPHSNLGGEPGRVTKTWHRLIGAFTYEEADGAIGELAAGGREHAPPPGVVAKMCAERASAAPEFDEAWLEVDRLKGRWNPAFPGREQPPPEVFSSAVVAAWAVPAWRELCIGPAPGTNGYGTFYAQQREAYRAMAARTVRDTALDAVGAPRRRSELKRAGGAMSEEAAKLLGKG